MLIHLLTDHQNILLAPQFGIGCVHLSIISIVARYTHLFNDSSVGNIVLDLVYLRTCLLNPSKALVV